MCEVHFSVNWAKTLFLVTFDIDIEWHNVWVTGTANIIIDLG